MRSAVQLTLSVAMLIGSWLAPAAGAPPYKTPWRSDRSRPAGQVGRAYIRPESAPKPSLFNPSAVYPSPSKPYSAYPSPAYPSLSNPSSAYPSAAYPSLSNPSLAYPSLSNPEFSSPGFSNAEMSEPSLSGPALSGPAHSTPSLVAPDLSDPTTSLLRKPRVSQTRVRSNWMAQLLKPADDDAATLDLPEPLSELPEPPGLQSPESGDVTDPARPGAARRGQFGLEVDEPDDDDYRLLIQAARNAVQLNDLATAEGRFREVLENFPEAALARAEFAGLLLRANRVRDAAEQYRWLLNSWPKNGKLRSAYGRALSRLGQSREALAELRRAVELNPRDEDSAVELARLLGQQKSFAEAYEVYLRNLARLDQKEPRVQRLLAPLLLGIDRPAEARTLYAQLVAANPDNVSFLTDYIRATAIYGDHAATAALVKQLESQNTIDAIVLTDLGKILFDLQDDLGALAVYRRALIVAPENAAARIGIARVHLRNLESTEAWGMLESFGHNCRDGEFLLTRANYHLVVGEYSESVALCEELLGRDSFDFDARLALADALTASGQEALAAAQYRVAVSDAPESARRRAAAKMAQHLAARRYYEDAILQLRALVAADPSDAFTIAILARVLVNANDPLEGLHVAASAMNAPGSYPRREVMLRSAMGAALLKQGEFQEALQQYREAAALPMNGRSDVIYGMYRAGTALGLGPQAEDCMMMSLALSSFPVGQRLLLADEASVVCDYEFAGLLLGQVVRGAPENAGALCRLGEIKLKTHAGDCGLGHFHLALDCSPANIRARMGLARALTVQRRPAEALGMYDELLRFQPGSIQYHREMARVLHAWKGFPAAAPVYAEAEALSESVLSDAHLPKPVSEPGVFVLGLDPVDGEVAGLRSEVQSRSIDGFEPLATIPIYEGAQELEPANIDAHFRLAQIFGGLNWTQASMGEYLEILEIDPCHRDSHVALERARLELRPQSYSGLQFFDQQGRDGLAEISQLRLTEMGRLPIGDEDEYIEAGYGYLLYNSPLIPKLRGNMARLRAQKRINPLVVALAEIRVEEFDFGFTTRPLFDAGFQARVRPNLDFRSTIFMENVAQNGGSIMQDIYRIGVNLEAQWRPTGWWTVDSLYRIADYSDDNLMNEFGIHNAFRVKLPPHQIRILADYDFINFQSSRSGVAAGESILDLVHPYFAPAAFSYATLGTEWKHWLSRDMFKGANQFWYQIYAGGRVDSASQAYFVFRASLQRDICSWVTASVETSTIQSAVYDNVAVGAQLVVRFR